MKSRIYCAAFRRYSMKSDPHARPLRFVFVSGNRTWGGSEELWSATAAELASDGHHVTALKSYVESKEPRIQRLRALGGRVRDLTRFPFIPRQLFSLIAILMWPFTFIHEAARLQLGFLFSRRPDLVVVSQGGNQDGWLLADVCRRLKLPYVLISQKASEMYWPTDRRLKRLRGVYRSARACYFVSEHNLRLTEEQMGSRLPHASVVRNPFLVPWERRSDWPDEQNGIRLACIGRLYPMEKGQDLLLRVLARDRWRERPLSVTFYGSGPHRAGLEDMARHLGLTSVTFGGFVRDVAAIWNDHHGLVLPTRCEGLPLVLVEAMLSGRVPIVTNVAGNAEIVENDVTGFLAAAATEDAIDEALERAWQRRAEWRAIGQQAAERVRTMVPEDPARSLADALLRVV